jgi:hypothetical protein
MSFQSQKEQRVHQIVALCVKKGKHPYKTAFCDFVIRACAALYNYDKRTAKTYVNILIGAWYFDKWRTLVQNNLRLTEEERQQWINSH